MSRILHVIAEQSAKEAMGRTVVEIAGRTRHEHHLLTGHLVDGGDRFASAVELGGPVGSFPLGRLGPLREHVRRLRPDVVHLHAGALGPLQALAIGLPRSRVVLTVYAWPSLPPASAVRRAGLRAARASNVLRARTVLTTLLPPGAAALAVRRATARAVLSPDPRVVERLVRRGVAVTHLPSGAPDDPRRAVFDADEPVVVFAGRAESVRGIDTLVDAFAAVRAAVPRARLRLLLIPRPELPLVERRVRSAGLVDAVELVTTPVEDLLAELTSAQVGAWPFKFDYTTSPPAMAVVEALSVGLPVVATDVACVRAVIRPGQDGLLVRPADPGALARALVRVLRDRSTWERFAGAGPAAVGERFGWHNTARVVEDTYRAIG